MYTITNEELIQRIENGCVYSIRLECGDEVLMSDDIFNADGTYTSTSQSDDIELGAVCSAYWRVRTSRSGNFVGKTYDLSLYVADIGGVTTLGDLYPYDISDLSVMTIGELYHMGHMVGEPIPMGEFTCVKAPRCGDGRELHLYDKLYFTDKPYNPTINLPALASAVEQDICNQLGIDNATSEHVGGFVELPASWSYRYTGFAEESGGGFLHTAPFDFTIDTMPTDGATMREMLGYIAAIHGQFGCIDRLGRYTRRWYAPQSLATIDSDHADEPTVSETKNNIVGIRCMIENGELTAGYMTGGRVLEMENPFMTQTLIRAVLVQVKRMSWYTAQVCERLGDPRHDIGDTVTIESGGEDHDIPITTIQFSFDGGLLANISAAGLTEEEQSI